MISEWARTSGRAKPVTTTPEVMNRPRSTGPDPSSSVENSSEPQWENRALGRGARTNVIAVFKTKPDQIFVSETRTTGCAPTRRGSQFDHKAHERMINRKPTARTKDRRITAVWKSRLDCVGVRGSGRKPTLQACNGHDRGGRKECLGAYCPSCRMYPITSAHIEYIFDIQRKQGQGKGEIDSKRKKKHDTVQVQCMHDSRYRLRRMRG